MKSKIKYILLILLIIPCVILAESQLEQYNSAVDSANNYINRYSDRSKYLLLNNR